MAVVPAIPASQIVSVTPSVLSAGGTALDLIGIFLTNNERPPVGQVLEFVSSADVAKYFGSTAQEAALAAIYFLGFDNSNVKPAKLLFAQYPLTAVGAYLRGGNIAAMPLPTLQAINGSLSVTIDGVVKSGTVNLASATSFSTAAELIGDALGIAGSTVASVTASIGGTFTCTSSGTTLSVSAVLTGSLHVGDVVSGSLGGNSLPGGCTIVSQLTGTIGGTGTYQLSAAATPGDLGSTTVTAASTTLNVTAVSSGTLGVADVLVGSGVLSGTYISSLGTGTGGTGTYNLSGAGQTIASESMTIESPAVTFDSVSGGFIVRSASTGSGSTISYSTGVVSGTLLLTQATGAVVSQGAGAADPTTFMNGVIDVTTDWVSFLTTWEPSDADKEAFAAWTNSQNNRFLYAMVDTAIVNTESSGPSAPVAAITAANYSGTAMIYEDPDIDTVGEELAAFLCGAVASIDFTETNGRTTMAFRRQTGLPFQISNGTQANYLKSYGLNFYGDYTTANQAFTWFEQGVVSGPYKWLDSYVDQIWLNNQLQLALMVLLDSAKSIPYNTPGYGLIEAACLDPILAAVNFGAIVPGVTLSESQKTQVNNSAGIKISDIIQQRGWYLQVKDASPQVRAARTSPPITLWYSDGGSIQSINLASIEVQ